MSDDKKKIREFVGELLYRRGDEVGFTDSESLVLSGRLDSLSVVEISIFLEDEFDVDFSDYAFDQGEFDSIEKMLVLVTDLS